nr:hypothetical protein [uncultured Undibacterium sp.]
MPQTVRVAIGEDFPPLKWPACCPECGTTKMLEKMTTRIGRVKSMRPNLGSSLSVKNEVMYLTYFICPDHAAETRWANRLLEKSPVMYLLRFISYFGAIFALALLLGPRRLSSFLELGALLALPVLGIIGVSSLIWAQMATTLWPIRFDPDQDVIIIRFRQAPYATKFRVMNLDATSSANTEELPWFKRKLVWQLVLVALLTAAMIYYFEY